MELDEFLVHHGVKGMHWGVRRDTHSVTPAPGSRAARSEVAKINKQLGKIDAQKYVDGESLQGWALRKQYNKAVKKNPEFKFGSLSEEEKIAYRRKASRTVTRSVVTRGALEVATVLAVGTFGVSKVKAHTDTKIGAEIAVILLAGQVGKTRLGQLSENHTANKVNELHRRRNVLEGRTPSGKKTRTSSRQSGRG